MNARTCTRLVPLTLLALLAYVPATYAATATDNMVVRTNVVSNCSVAADTLNFGVYDKSVGNTTDANVNVTCTTGQKYDVGIGLGNHNAGTIRQMANNGNLLPYQLYLSDCTTALDSSSTGLVNQGTGNGVAQPYNVCGKILGSQPVVSGPYQDTLLVTVTYN